MTAGQPPSRLHRALGVRGATVVGLSAMLGTGVFAVWTPAVELAGTWLIAALLIAAIVASLNAVSSARLAMVHPESGGSYAYGRLRLNRLAGVLAGVAFIVGKSASAAAAALTIGAYVWPEQQRVVAWIAIAIALAIDVRGIVKSTRVNAVLVLLVLVVIIGVVLVGSMNADDVTGPGTLAVPASPLAVLAAAGLLFVAFAGYARVTVLGEEVRDPAHTIPRAMVLSFAIVLVVYLAVAAVVTVLAARGLELAPASLSSVVALAGSPALDAAVRVGAVLGAGSVLISLLAGIGRTMFAMAGQGDAPQALAAVSSRRVPARAAVVAAVLAALVAGAGRLGWALALSGASILTYYAVAHLAARTLPAGQRPPGWLPWAGLVGCLAVLGALAVAAVAGQLPGG